MGAKSNIEWTGATWNPVVGCTRITPGCAHCYAKKLHDMRHKAFKAGKLQNVPQYAEPFETVQMFEDRLEIPLRWRQPRRIFANSLSDLFHDEVPLQFIAEVFAVMACAHWHTFQVLTKRPTRMRELLTSAHFQDAYEDALEGWEDLTEEILERRGEFDVLERRTDDFRAMARELPLPNVWLGVSVENQRWADERIPLLERTPAAVRFLSCEPLLGPLELSPFLHGIDWVIVGGESGPDGKRRDMNLEWLTYLVEQCQAYERATFVKQDSGPRDGQRGRIPEAVWALKQFPQSEASANA